MPERDQSEKVRFASLREGSVLRDRYRIEGVLGRGGMGVVYSARHLELERAVAIKVLESTDSEFLDRFRREVKLLAALSHPNVIQVLDSYGGDDVTPPYLVMERLFGRTLGEAIRDGGPMDDARVVEIGLQLTDAVSAAHAKGIVHRDVKPGNVFLTETTLGRDAIKLLDFGVARDLHAKDDLTRDGAVVGTLAWLSPEQIDGEPADVRSDVYAIGATLFFCLFGRKPYPQGSLGEAARAISEGRRDSAAKLRPDSEVAKVIDRAMARDRGVRYASADELGKGLKECLALGSGTRGRSVLADEVPPSAAPTKLGLEPALQTAPPAARPRRRGVAVAALVAGAAAMSALAFAFLRPPAKLSASDRAPSSSTDAPTASPPTMDVIAPLIAASAVASASASTSVVAPPASVIAILSAKPVVTVRPPTSVSHAGSTPPPSLPSSQWRYRAVVGALDVACRDPSIDSDTAIARFVAPLRTPGVQSQIDACSARTPPPFDHDGRIVVEFDASGRVVAVAEATKLASSPAGAFALCLTQVMRTIPQLCPGDLSARSLYLAFTDRPAK